MSSLANAPESDASPRRGRLELALLCVLGAIGLFGLWQMRHPNERLAQFSAAQAHIHTFVAHLGPWGPVLFIAAYAAAMLLIWFPCWPCSLIGGFLFGVWPATIYSLLGSTLGAVGVFTLTRAGLAHRIPKTHPLLRKLDAGFKRDALEYIIALRLMPLMPFGMIHVGSAILGVSLKAFALGTFIGMIPCTFLYSIVGADFARIAARGGALDAATFLNPGLSLPLFGIAALALVPVAIRRFRRAASSPTAP